MTDNREQKTGDRGRRTEGRVQRAVDGIQKTESRFWQLMIPTSAFNSTAFDRLKS